MNRREFLCATGFVFVTGTSGCLSGGSDADVDSRFTGEECTRFRDTDETRCYHEVGNEPDVRLVPEQEVGDPTEEPMALTLHNDSDSAVGSCPLSECWNLHKLIDGEWRSMTPFKLVPSVLRFLEAGESHTWNFEMSQEDIEMEKRIDAGESDMAYTGPGRYAFSVSVTTEREEGDDIELVALFEIEGEPLELEPIGVEGHELEDDTVHVRMDQDEDDGGRVEISAQRVDGTLEEEVDSMLTEIAAQLYPIRNTLSFFDRYDAEEVRFEGGSSLVGQMVTLNERNQVYAQTQESSVIEVIEDGPVETHPYRYRFLYEGTYYEIVVEEMEGSNE